VRYYEENQFFYDLFWTDRATRSMNYGFWDATTLTLARAFRNQNRSIGRALRLRKSDVLLEAGCGTGGATVWLAERYGLAGCGITLCRHQAERGRQLARERGAGERVEFLMMDFTRTGFRDGSFTRIFASESVCYAADKAEFLSEAHRLLQPGGRLVVVDGFRAPRALDARERRVLAEWGDGWAVPELAPLDGFAGALRVAGFVSVTFSDLTPKIMPSARRILLRGLCAHPLALAGRRLGLLSEGHFTHVRSSILQYLVWGRRIGVYGMFAADRPG